MKKPIATFLGIAICAAANASVSYTQTGYKWFSVTAKSGSYYISEEPGTDDFRHVDVPVFANNLNFYSAKITISASYIGFLSLYNPREYEDAGMAAASTVYMNFSSDLPELDDLLRTRLMPLRAQTNMDHMFYAEPGETINLTTEVGTNAFNIDATPFLNSLLAERENFRVNCYVNPNSGSTWAGGGGLEVTQTSGAADCSVTVSYYGVPEPSSMALMSLGLVGGIFASSQRKKRR